MPSSVRDHTPALLSILLGGGHVALRDVVFQRLQKLIGRFVPGGLSGPLTGKEVLTGPPILLDVTTLQGQFRGWVNENTFGFADIQQISVGSCTGSKVAKSDLKASTKVDDLVDVLMKRTCLKSITLYEAKMNERVRLAL